MREYNEECSCHLEIDSLQNTIADLEGQLSSAIYEIESASGDQEALNRDIHDLESKISDLDYIIHEHEASIKEKDNYIEDLEIELMDIREKLNSLPKEDEEQDVVT